MSSSRVEQRVRGIMSPFVADANDVLYEMTRYNGAQMWTVETWAEYQPRLNRWMKIFEETGQRHGLHADKGCLLGTEAPGIADLATYALWGTMIAKLPPLEQRLLEQAPGIAGLCQRMGALPAQQDLRQRSDEAYGEEWCSGHIEASLRAVL